MLVGGADAASWQLPAEAIAAVVFAGVLSSFVNYSAMAWVNSITSPTLVMIFYPLQSFLSPLFASIFLHESISAVDYCGGAVIVFGLACCIYSTVLEAPDAGSLTEQESATLPTPSSASARDGDANGVLIAPADPEQALQLTLPQPQLRGSAVSAHHGYASLPTA